MNRLVLFTIVLASLGLTPGPAHAQNVVVPNNKAAVEGNADNALPFNLGGFADPISSVRYQQVYDHSQFGTVSGPEAIITILFRSDAAFRPQAVSGGPFSTVLPDIQINLSTTGKAPDGLSANFGSNVGPDDENVFSGPLSLSSAFVGPAGGPKQFDIVIHLMTPFTYDPGAGNLLLDVRNYGGGRTVQFDAEYTAGDSISRAVSASSADSATASDVDTLGLVTEFQFGSASTPEPGGLALLATGGLPLLAVLRRRRV